MADTSQAGRRLIYDILQLQTGESFFIIFDAFGYQIADYCAEVATGLSIPFSAQFIPRATQLQHIKANEIPELVFKVVKEPGALLFAVSGHEECTKFRANVLNTAKELNLKILHLPGVDYKLFSSQLINVDITQLKKEGIAISKYLETTDTVEIITKSKLKNNNVHRLNIKIDNKKRKVHQDFGIVHRGQFAQLPPGEVYLAPMEFIANGDIAINGSAPERVFRGNDTIILHFIEGVVDMGKSYFSDSLNGNNFKDELLKYEKANKLNLALGELGIGLNKTMSRLTGRPIRDEKAYGTAHIALGENTPFEGKINCDSHIDLIFIPVEIKAGDQAIPVEWGL